MLSRNPSNKPNWLLLAGLLCVSASSGWRALTVHLAPAAEALIDFLCGLGIGIMLAGGWRKRRCGIVN